MKHARAKATGTSARAGGAGESAAGRSGAAALAACLAVFVIALVVHYPGTRAKAYFLDDDQFLLNNVLVKNPGWTSAGRFLTEVWKPSTVEGYYKPLTMISLMTDYVAGGRSVDPGVFRRTNLALHALTAALLAWLIYRLLRSPGAALAAATLFAVHPVNVEAVIWIAERKTVLAAFFALICLVAYVEHHHRPRRGTYLVCTVAFVAALLSKPIVVPLPLLLVLLDYWPLGRIAGRADALRAIRTKLALFVVAVLFAVITLVSQSRAAATQLPTEWTAGRVPLVICHNLVFYLRELFWPVQHWPFHPFPRTLNLAAPGMLVGVVGTLLLVVAVVIAARWSRGAVFAAAFFLVAVFPTLGVIGFTVVIASDKYAYIPSLGIYVALAALMIRVWKAPLARPYRIVSPLVVVACAAACVRGVRSQHQFWQSDDALYAHVLKMAPSAAIPRVNYGVLMHDRGRYDEAVALYREAARVRPRHAPAYNNLGNTLVAQGRTTEALEQFHKALELYPDYPEAHVSLGYALSLTGRIAEAIDHYHRALQLEPDNVQALNNLGNAWLGRGEADKAIAVFERALAADPTWAATYNNLAGAKVRAGDPASGVEYYRRAIALEPRLLPAHYNLAQTYQRMSRIDDARAAYRRALEIAEAEKSSGAARRIRERLTALERP